MKEKTMLFLFLRRNQLPFVLILLFVVTLTTTTTAVESSVVTVKNNGNGNDMNGRKSIYNKRRLKGVSFAGRNILERRHRQSIQDETEEDHRMLVSQYDSGHPDDSYYYYHPCTYYYGDTKKSKFNDYDDDWYDDCKTFDFEKPSRPHHDGTTGQEGVYGIGPDETLFPPVHPIPIMPSAYYSPVESPWIDDNSDTNNIGDIGPSPVPVPSDIETRPPQPIPTPSPPDDNGDRTRHPTKAPKEEDDDDKEDSKGKEEDQDSSTATNPPFLVDEDPMCQAAKDGEVYPTSVNYTVYYQYELVAEKNDDWRDVVWPAVDATFQRYLAQKLVDCSTSSTTSVDSNNNKYRRLIQGVSPEPHDSFGTLTTDENTNACTYLNDQFDEDEDKYVCDKVTGSVTIYYSEIEYTNVDNLSELLLTTQNDVFQYLQSAVNGNENEYYNYGGNDDGRSRKRSLLRQTTTTRITQSEQQPQEDFLDERLGIYGLYFLSRPTDELLNDGISTPGGLTLTGSVGDMSNSSNQKRSKENRSVNPAVATSVTAFTLLTMLVVGFAIHRGRKSTYDNDLDEISFIKPVETKRTDTSDLPNPESIVCRSFDFDEDDIVPVRTINTTHDDSDLFPIQNSPNVFRRSPRKYNHQQKEKNDAQYYHESYQSAEAREDPPSPAAETPIIERLMTPTITPRESSATTPRTIHRTMYTVEETVEEEGSYNFSRDGVSMRLTSPEFGASRSISRSPQSDPPTELCSPIHRQEEEEKDLSTRATMNAHELMVLSTLLDGSVDSPTKRTSIHQSPGTPSSEQWTTRTISVANSASTSALLAAANRILNRTKDDTQDDDQNSTMTSGATFGVSPKQRLDLSLGSSVVPPPSEPVSFFMSQVSSGYDNDSESERHELAESSIIGYETPPLKDRTTSSKCHSSGNWTGQSARSIRNLTLPTPVTQIRQTNKSLSPTEEPYHDFGDHWRNTTSTPKSSKKLDPPSSAEMSRQIRSADSVSSPDSFYSTASRTEYLKSRRRALEERFHSYKSRSTDRSVEPQTSEENEFNLIPMDSSEGLSVQDEEGTSNRRCLDTIATSHQPPGAFPTQEEKQPSPIPVEGRTRSRTPSRKFVRSRGSYTSLNDIEELLDVDQEWKQSDANESMRLDAFVTTRSRTVTEDDDDEMNVFEIGPTGSKSMETSRLSSTRMEPRIYPFFQSDTVQL